MKNISQHLLQDLIDVLSQLSNQDYTKSVALLHGNSISKHIRHILNFYKNLLDANDSLLLDYDLRVRDSEIESNKELAITVLQDYLTKVNNLDLTKKVQLTQHFNQVKVSISTSLTRELLYNIEHTIHHMAIIRIALEQSFSYVKIPAHFGIAPSTLSHCESSVS